MSAKRKAVVEAQPLELAIVVEGKIIESNFPAFREDAERQIEAISFDLVTDEDFDRADADAKGLKRFEDTLSASKAAALAQMDELNTLLGSVDELSAIARKVRLELQKRVDTRKAEIRDGIVRDGLAAIEIRSAEFTEQIKEAIKGKKSLVKMQEAVTETVLNINDRIRENSLVFEKAQEMIGDAVAYGREAFLCLPVEGAKVEMERRIERHRTALREAAQKAEAERLRKEKEEREAMDRLAAQQEAERARQEKAEQEAPAPSAEPIVKESLPVATLEPEPAPIMREENEEEELETFKKILMSAFAPVKDARKALKHPANIDRAQAFADTLGTAWKTLTEEGGQ